MLRELCSALLTAMSSIIGSFLLTPPPPPPPPTIMDMRNNKRRNVLTHTRVNFSQSETS